MENKHIFDKYPNIHPLIVLRTIEYLKNEKDIIYNLNGIPKRYPILWDRKNKKWINKNASTDKTK